MKHYARSLEKFYLKTLTWETANQASNKYDMVEYMNRAYSWTYDPAALLYSCLVRYEINNSRRKYLQKLNISTESITDFGFLRSGSNWLREEEFNKDHHRSSNSERLFKRSYGIHSNTTAEVSYNPSHVTEVIREGLFMDYYDHEI